MGRKIPDVLTSEEQVKLIGVFNTRYYTSRRNRCIVNLFLAAGLRLSELINLKWKNLNLMTGQLKIVAGKGGKDRVLWVSDLMLQELENWRIDQSGKVGDVTYVFTNNKGEKLVDRDVREMINNYSNKAIGRKISPHTLRHTFATDLYRVTKNIRLVQKALGHSDLSTTMIYTHIVDDELEKSLKMFRQK